jgi:hypothetical protein
MPLLPWLKEEPTMKLYLIALAFALWFNSVVAWTAPAPTNMQPGMHGCTQSETCGS